MHRAALPALALAGACATGCYHEACVEPFDARPFDEICVERYESLLLDLTNPEDELANDWCSGELHAFTTCRALGFTLHCGPWVQPASEAATVLCGRAARLALAGEAADPPVAAPGPEAAPPAL